MKNLVRTLKFHRAVLNRIFRTSKTPRELVRRLSLYAAGCVDLCLAAILHAWAQVLFFAARIVRGREAA